MKTDSQHINKQQLLDTINTEYGLHVTFITFVPQGEEAFTYIGQKHSTHRYFIRVQPTASAANLERVYPILYTLHHQHGVSSVVAPYMTRSNTLVVVYRDYLVGVFPYIEGKTLYQHGASETDIQEVATLLARVHQLPLTVPALHKEHFDNPFKAPILRALAAAGTPSSAQTVLQRKVCQLLLAEQADIVATLERMDQLQVQAQSLASAWVLTHGDPNRDNFLKDQQGRLHLTDWGELAIGPAERDLMQWKGHTFEVFLRHYAQFRPHLPLHAELFEFYLYRWSMQEIADYATRILFRQLGPTEDEHAWAELQDYLPFQHGRIAQGLQEIQRISNHVLA